MTDPSPTTTQSSAAPASFLSLSARPWAWGIVVAMVGLFITIAPAVITVMIIGGLTDDELKLHFGEFANLMWWVLAILGHLLVIGIFIAVLFARALGGRGRRGRGPSRIAIVLLMPMLGGALVLDIIVTAGLWFMAVMSHPHGFR